MRKTISILLVVALLLSCGPINVFAQGATVPAASATVTVESTYADIGGTVEVNVLISNNPGVAGATLSIGYHSDLTLIEAESGEAFSDLDFSGNEVDVFSNPSKFSWDSENTESTTDGVILKLTFRVSEQAKYNSQLGISVSYRYGDVYNDECDLTLELIDGYVTVIDYIPGDLFEDGVINTKDVRIMRQLINGNCSIEVKEAAADVNADGVVNTKDTRLLRRYINGGYGVKLLPGVPKCSHTDMQAIAAKEATCTEDGHIAYWYCSNCSKYFSDAETKTEIAYADIVIAATGHTEVIDEAVEPSCSKTGLTEGSHCSVCNEILVAQLEVGKTNHTPGAQATCTEDQICTACGEVLESANGHIPGIEASCTVPQTCTVCQTVLAEATGHSLTYVEERDPVNANDPGNCAYWLCSVCNKCYLDEDATQEIALADTVWKLFKVTYFCDENNSKQTQWYKVGVEVEELPTPKIDGYKFNYWMDGDGKRVNSISAENTKNLELYAAVDLEEYTIYLGGTWKYDDLTYNIKEQVDLPVPIEDGLTFAGWRDADGKVEEDTDSVGVRRWRIPKGTTGDIELMAQWKDNRNLIVPDTRVAGDRYVDSGYDETEGYYWFLYSLGEIQNVVLDLESDLIKTKHDGGFIEGSLSLAESTTVEESVAKSVSKTVSHTVTNSTDWSKKENWKRLLAPHMKHRQV